MMSYPSNPINTKGPTKAQLAYSDSLKPGNFPGGSIEQRRQRDALAERNHGPQEPNLAAAQASAKASLANKPSYGTAAYHKAVQNAQEHMKAAAKATRTSVKPHGGGSDTRQRDEHGRYI